MSPTQAWLDAAATKPPELVFRVPDRQIYFSSKGAHYPDGVGGEPHHAGVIKMGGLPEIRREIQNLFTGRFVMTIGRGALVDQGAWDSGFTTYDNTLRGAKLLGYVTFPGLDFNTDAEFYLNARISKADTNDRSEMTIDVIDAVAEELLATRLAAGTYTSAALGDVVKARLTEAGLNYPADYDTTSWNAWTAAGKPGSFLVTGTWSEGNVFDIIEPMISGTLTVYGFQRDGKFFIEQFTDLGDTPSVDIDLTTTGTIIQGGKIAHHEPVYRRVEVKYSGGGGGSEIRVVNLSASNDWWLTAREMETIDIGIVNQTDAATLADALIDFFAAEHVVSDVLVDRRPLGFNLLATVKLDLGAHKLPTGLTLYHRIIGINEAENKGHVGLKLWTKVGPKPDYSRYTLEDDSGFLLTESGDFLLME